MPTRASIPGEDNIGTLVDGEAIILILDCALLNGLCAVTLLIEIWLSGCSNVQDPSLNSQIHRYCDLQGLHHSWSLASLPGLHITIRKEDTKENHDLNTHNYRC